MKSLLTAITILSALGLALRAAAYTAEDFISFPPLMRQTAKPSTTIVLDISESMLRRVHEAAFNPAVEYAGYFDSESYYSYADAERGECFIPDDASGAWNGNFLNWAVTTRFDVMRKALTGGPYDGQARCLTAAGPRTDDAQLAEYDDSSPVSDLCGRTRFMTPHRRALRVCPAPEAGAVRFRSEAMDGTHVLRVRGEPTTGALQSIPGTARIALFVAGGREGGRLMHPMDDAENNLADIVASIDRMEPDRDVSLTRALRTVLGFIHQGPPADDASPADQDPTDDGHRPSGIADPFHFPELGKNLPCTRQNVVIVADGTRSGGPQGAPDSPAHESNREQTAQNPDPYYATDLADVALAGHTTDLRPDTGMDGRQSWTLFTVSVAQANATELMEAARFGNFRDMNGNGRPDLAPEYDADGDGSPDGYFEAGAGRDLRAALATALQRATAGSASGGQGVRGSAGARGPDSDPVLFQAVFFPPSDEGTSPPPWSGQIHAYFVDDAGNLREDTDADGLFDPSRDRIVEFDGERILVRHEDGGNGQTAQPQQQEAEELGSILDVRFPWTTSSWLNALTDEESLLHRHDYGSPVRQRHILTFADANRNMVPDDGEVQPFALHTPPQSLDDAGEFHTFLTLFESGPGSFGLDLSRPNQRALDALRRTDPDAFGRVLATLAKRQVDFIRGAEVGTATMDGITDHARSRRRDGTTWRLGDIVHSGPAVVGRPAENYHLIYGDRTYEAFVKKYADRRRMVYAGANDGMLHAFNAGFASAGHAGFGATPGGRTPFPLGMELWAYVPYNLLPHLRWLMRPDYGEKLHVAYMDLEPRVFDVRIFYGPDGVTPVDDAHPEGWGTILVAGMRLGGARIGADIDKTDGDAFNPEVDRTMTSAYVVMDITDPERPPRLLAEIALPRLGFTTCRPAVMPADGRWHLVFGSGPADAAGNAEGSVLAAAASAQAGRLFIIDLSTLGAKQKIRTIAAADDAAQGLAPIAVLEENALVSDPAVIDSRLGQKGHGTVTGDLVFFGTVSGTPSAPRGALYRLCARERDPGRWEAAPLAHVGLPISAAPAVSVDETGRRWILFGTGRLFSPQDPSRQTTMSLFGIREPDSSEERTVVDAGELFDSAMIEIAAGGADPQEILVRHRDTNSTRSWSWLNKRVDNASGWRRELPDQGEQVIERATLWGGAAMFPSVLPDGAPCDSSTIRRLWMLHFQTGTALPDMPAPHPGHVRRTYVEAGNGQVSPAPAFLGGRTGNTRARVINPSGPAAGIDVPSPHAVSSGVLFWKSFKY